MSQFFSKNQKPLFFLSATLIFIIASFTRFFLLTSIPTTFSHDEMGYLINAKSVAVSGVGRYGNWQPLSLKPVEASLAELPTGLLAVFFKLPFNSMIDGRLLPVLMSLTLPFFIASISFSLFKSKSAAFFSWVIALFNPWIWQNGRLVFDIPISLWFYVLGFALFLKFQSWQKLWALIPLFIGFYSYQGFKLILPFIGLGLGAYTLYENQKEKFSFKKFGPSLILPIASISLLVFYLVHQFGQQTASQARLSQQLITPNSDAISQAVNTDRRLALVTPLNNLFVNKYLQTGKEILGRYLQVFGPRELFLEISAAASPFAVWNHGPFYLIDALLIALGLFALVSQKKFAQLWLLGFLAVTCVAPAVINQSVWLYFRPSFVFPLLIILAGAGAALLWQGRQWLFWLAALLYAAAVINFGFLYFIRYPVYSSESIYFGPRILAEYLHRLPETQKVVVFEKEPEYVFTSLIFYFDLLTPDFARIIQTAYNTKQYSYKNVTMVSCLPVNFTPELNTTYIVDSDVPDCIAPEAVKQKAKTQTQIFATFVKSPIFIRSVKDNGVNYTIYGQTLCENSEKFEHFINPHSLRIFNVSQLPVAEFCQNWLTKDLPKPE